MKIWVEGHDPSMRNWARVHALVDISDINNKTVEIINSHVIRTKPAGQRIRKSSHDIEVAQELYRGATSDGFSPKAIFVEVPHGSQSASSMKGMGICHGVLGSMRANGIPFFELTAKQLKDFIGGNPSKMEVMEWVDRMHPYAVENYVKPCGGANLSVFEHVADAILAIHVGIETNEFNNLINLLRK